MHSQAQTIGGTRAFASGVAIALFAFGAAAQTPTPTSSTADAQDKLRGVEDTLRAGEDQQKQIERDLAAQKVEMARVSAQLIDATAKVQEAERRQADAVKRLQGLDANARALEASLDSRKALVAEVLAALQRMGRNPPPAILLKPGDMAEAIRAATAIGGVLPELRDETEALAADLDRLKALRVAIADERDAAARQAADLELERKSLADLVEQRQAALQSASSALTANQARNADLEKQAATLKELLAKAEQQANEQAKAVAEGRQAADEVESKAASLRGAEPGRLRPAVAFAEARGSLPLPATGSVLRPFGAPDGYGGVEKGLSLAARPGSIVAAPMDASVIYAGPYRTYGQLLILNAGGGYNMVIAGLGRISVLSGQFVLAGEPIAVMGDGTTRSATAAAVGASEPTLYIELRKDGQAVDPGPWFIKPEDEKARG